MLFRMGINLGDVVVQEGDLLGDGVNVAARIQTVAEPGGICISGSVYDQIQNKLSLQFKSLWAIRASRTSGSRSARSRSRTARPGRCRTALRPPGGAHGRRRSPASLIAARRARRRAATGSIAKTKRSAPSRARSPRSSRAQKKAADEARAARRRTCPSAPRRPRARRSASGSSPRRPSAKRRCRRSCRALEEARRRADAERKRMDEERTTRRGERKRLDEARDDGRVDKKPAAPPRGVASAARAKSAGVNKNAPPSQSRGIGKFDGSYDGQMCNFPNNPERRLCWPVTFKFDDGKPASGTGRAAAPRESSSTCNSRSRQRLRSRRRLNGWNAYDGSPMRRPAQRSGRRQIALEITGRWANGAPVTGELTRRPEAAVNRGCHRPRYRAIGGKNHDRHRAQIMRADTLPAVRLARATGPFGRIVCRA